MPDFQKLDLQDLPQFPQYQSQLAIVERTPADNADIFFHKLMQTPFRAIGQAYKSTSGEDIQDILEEEIPTELQAHPFYAQWISDMAEICNIFCDTLNSQSVGFFLGTERGCRRYHIDNVPMRLLVTYAGKGTEWLPDDAANREALGNGAPNADIVKDPSKRQFMNNWDIAIFRGGPKGLLHRTPDAALNGPSILMRLDHASFWDSILEQENINMLIQAMNA